MLFSLAFYYIFFVFNQPKLLQNLITIPQKAVFRIRIILIRMIRGSASDSDFFLDFFCIRLKTHNDVFSVVILSLLVAYINQNM